LPLKLTSMGSGSWWCSCRPCQSCCGFTTEGHREAQRTTTTALTLRKTEEKSERNWTANLWAANHLDTDRWAKLNIISGAINVGRVAISSKANHAGKSRFVRSSSLRQLPVCESQFHQWALFYLALESHHSQSATGTMIAGKKQSSYPW
jgi:hypothetical protein